MSRFVPVLFVFAAGASAPGCGGKETTVGHRGDVDGAGGDTVVFGSGGGSAGGNAAMSGASPDAGPSVRGTSTGGGTGTDGAADAGLVPDAPTLAQWDCEGQRFNCEQQQAGAPDWVRLESPCPVDPTRPRSRNDCASGEWFVCDAALFRGATVEVSCRCMAEHDAGDPCRACNTFARADYQPLVACSHREKRCGCAITKKY